jgi:hypothetical protein
MEELDLGSGFSLRWTSWAPDRELNPQYNDLPDVEKFGAILTCKHGIEGSILFNHGESYERIFPNRPFWKVISWDPLTLEPSIQTGCCHGYIREGKWKEV